MLICCSECGAQVSDQALMCPHCGFPPKKKLVNRMKPGRHLRLPNGFGQITEIKNGNLRRPFRVMVTVGKTPEGRPICKILKPEGYFATYNEAYAALVKYNMNPYDFDKDMTMQQLYEIWSMKHFGNIKAQSTFWIKRCWTYCSSIYTMKVRDVRSRHLKGCINEGFKMVKGKPQYPKNTDKENLKSMFNLMFDYAVEYELTDRNYARTFSLDKNITKEIAKARKGHISFTDEEMQALWAQYSDTIADVILIQCYTGLRPQELCEIRLENVDLEGRFLICGMKTEAGENRYVPIHDCILPLVSTRYQQAVELGSEKLLNIPTKSNTQVKPINYLNYKRRFADLMQTLGLNPEHKPHDPRKQFATMAKKYRLDEYAIKMIIGHKIYDITENIYTDRDPMWLHEEIQKIPGDEYRKMKADK